MLKVNLGAGSSKIDGYVSLDKFEFFEPDIVHDLETFPYPFDDNSVDNIIMSHVLEHIGQHPDTFHAIIKELYRICKPAALIDIAVPHPRHDDFISDPTHVRAITPLGLALYDRELNEEWERTNASNSPLALIYNVNFKIRKVKYVPDKIYSDMLDEKKITQDELDLMAKQYNNVIKHTLLQLEVIKPNQG
jgi:SAM-dependent methyltransferase